MSLFGRLFGSKPAAPAPNTVTIAEDIAVGLASDGAVLTETVDAILRSYLEARARAPEEASAPGMPFWLDRGRVTTADESADLEDQLRDRVIQRHASGGDS